MKRKLISLALVGLLIVFGITLVAAREGLSIEWWTVDSGGGALEEDVYTLTGTIGEPEGGGSIGNGGYSVSGGFFPGVEPGTIVTGVYLPLLMRGE